MRKLTQNISAGQTLSFPSCKTFVYLRSEYAVSFKFITMFNKIDRTIDNFQDSFSVTANTYFLRVEITSENAQELSCILIEDTGIDYTPITGDVFISNDDNNHIPVKSYNVNSRDYPVPVYSPEGVQTNHKIDSQKFYKSNYYERFKSCGYTPSQNAASDLECYALFPSVDSPYCFLGGYTFITEMWLTPETDNFFEMWSYHRSSKTWLDYDTHINWLTSLDSYVDNYYGNDLEMHEIRYKNVTRETLSTRANQYLMYSFPIKAGEIFYMKFDYPIPVPSRSSKSSGNTRIFTFTTKTNCHFEFNINVESLSHDYLDNKIYNPREL